MFGAFAFGQPYAAQVHVESGKPLAAALRVTFATRGALLIPAVRCRPRIEAMLSPGVWTSLMVDVLSELGIRAKRGIAGNGPMDRTAGPGTLEFTLRNDAGNSGRTRSWYSPIHPNCRAGWVEGIPVRLMARYYGVDYPLWTGKIRTIDPTPGATPQRVAVLCQDAAADLSGAVVRSIPPQINQSETQLLDAVMAALPSESRPPTVFDAALDTYAFAFDNVGDGANALGLIQDAVMSAVGAVYVDGLGQLRYVNRQTEAGRDPVLDIGAGDLIYRGPGFAGASSLRNVFNRVRVTIHPKTIVPNMVLFHSEVIAELPPQQPVEVWDSYSDPNNHDRLIGGYAFTPLSPPTDFVASYTSTSGGGNATASLSITIAPFTSSAKSILVNQAGVTIYATMRQLRGSGIYDNAPVTFEAFQTMPYGERPVAIDLPYQDKGIIASDLANYFLAQYSNRGYAGDQLTYDPQRRDTLMKGALATDIGSVITASEEQTGVNRMNFIVRSIEYAFENVQSGAYLLVRYGISPHVTSTPGLKAWIFDHPVQGLLGTGTTFGFA